jgi:hypothetical protein
MEHEPILQIGTNRMTLHLLDHKSFKVKVPDTFEWQRSVKPDIKGGLV